jgi:hypothetical protein
VWELPALPRRRLRLPSAVLPTLIAVAVGLTAAAAWRGHADPAAVQPPLRGHTSTALADGRVLVVGGEDEEGVPRAAALLFEPDDGRWRQTGRPWSERSGHTATGLPDGRVLVVGGRGAAAGSAELYDPRTGRWRSAASPPRPLLEPATVLLGTGRVLALGADGAHLYDPRADRWSAAAAPNASTSDRRLLPLPDGRALLIGLDGGTTVQAYEGAADAWSPLPGPSVPIGSPVELLADGRVLVGSGGAPAAVTQEPLIFDARAGTWSKAGVMSLNRRVFAAALLPDGRLLAIGGGVLAGQPARGMLLASVERFDPTSGGWSAAAPMLLPRVGHTATALPDGRILVVGGQVRPGPAAELYDPRADRWTVVSP